GSYSFLKSIGHQGPDPDPYAPCCSSLQFIFFLRIETLEPAPCTCSWSQMAIRKRGLATGRRGYWCCAAYRVSGLLWFRGISFAMPETSVAGAEMQDLLARTRSCKCVRRLRADGQAE
uniref:Uncharacterized protein n=1 Tax=Triticum urartu TaxID=4572 RepID=A0A8R7TPG1_TRIUA